MIVRYCRARLGRVSGQYHIADDVAQEVCIAVLSALPRYRDMGRPFASFVFGIAAHKIADALRSAVRAAVPTEDLPDGPDDRPGPEETVVALHRGAARPRAADAAARPPARAVLLRVVAGLSAEETGNVLGMSAGRYGWRSTGHWPGSARWPERSRSLDGAWPRRPGSGRAVEPRRYPRADEPAAGHRPARRPGRGAPYRRDHRVARGAGRCRLRGGAPSPELDGPPPPSRGRRPRGAAAVRPHRRRGRPGHRRAPAPLRPPDPGPGPGAAAPAPSSPWASRAPSSPAAASPRPGATRTAVPRRRPGPEVHGRRRRGGGEGRPRRHRRGHLRPADAPAAAPARRRNPGGPLRSPGRPAPRRRPRTGRPGPGRAPQGHPFPLGPRRSPAPNSRRSPPRSDDPRFTAESDDALDFRRTWKTCANAPNADTRDPDRRPD